MLRDRPHRHSAVQVRRQSGRVGVRGGGGEGDATVTLTSEELRDTRERWARSACVGPPGPVAWTVTECTSVAGVAAVLTDGSVRPDSGVL